MEIQIKRNKQENSQFPSSLLPGEPMWFKDKLYVGSVGTTLGGQSTTGTPIAIGAQSDWDAGHGETGHVLNRTHYRDVLTGEDAVIQNDDYSMTVNSTSSYYTSQTDMIAGIDPSKKYTVKIDVDNYQSKTFRECTPFIGESSIETIDIVMLSDTNTGPESSDPPTAFFIYSLGHHNNQGFIEGYFQIKNDAFGIDSSEESGPVQAHLEIKETLFNKDLYELSSSNPGSVSINNGNTIIIDPSIVIELEEGDYYTFEVDGTEYTRAQCKIHTESGIQVKYIGNLHLAEDSFTDTGENFFAYSIPGNSTCIIVSGSLNYQSASNSSYVAIYPESRKVYHKLSINYIPIYGQDDGTNWTALTIGEKTKGIGSVQSDWNQNDSTAPDYIKNKPDNGVTIISISYSQLRSKCSVGNLVPGQKYRINDYVTTTAQTDTTSANHAFDLIVTAIGYDKLDARASASLPSSGDSYFGGSIEMWQIWYDIENDTLRYAWADSSNGKGVIYRLIDEWGNDCPYDFKNILFSKSNSYTNAYTFNYTNSGTNCDFSRIGNKCYGNVIKPYISSLKFTLNFNVINGGGGQYPCYDNIFKAGCYNNTLRDSCYKNTFSEGCHDNTTDGYFQSNKLGKNCYNNTFGISDMSNIFGNGCHDNTFGDYTSNNTFENSCYSNSLVLTTNSHLGNGCNNNAIYNRSFLGNYCSFNNINGTSNRLGNGCNHITIPYYSDCNTFGDGCSYISFGDSDSQGGSYCSYNIIENGNSYIRIYNTTDPSSSNLLKNVYIAQGVNNSNTYVDISTISRNLSYRTTVGRDSQGALRIYNEDDPAGSGGSSTLSGLTDTTISSPADGQVLTYDGTTSKWVNAAIAGANNSTITIQKNGTTVDTFTLNQSTDKSINITVPTSASDVGALSSSTKYGASITTSMDSSTYVLSTTLKDQDGNTLGTVQTVDLPLETMVVSGSYDSTNKKVVLTLKNGSTVDFSVADLVSGLQTEITSSNKLSADLISDGTTNKAYTATEKTKLSGIETGAQVNVKPDWNAASGAAAEILNKPTIPTVNNATLTIQRNGTNVATFTANASSNATANIEVPAAPGTLNTTATTAQSTSSSEALSGNITLHKVAKTGTYSDLIGTPTIPTVNNATLTIQKNGTTVNTFTANASSNVTANISVRELPEVTSSDNNKILMVVNGAWAAQTVDIQAYYTGSSEPSNSIGNNGDLYLQTN